MFTQVKFKQCPNTLLVEALAPDKMSADEIKVVKCCKKISPELTDNISLVSMLYIYTGTPPMGYGTQAPKVAETVIRSYTFNRKKEKNQKYNDFDDFPIENMHWLKDDGTFPHNEIHGNFIVSEVADMTKNLLKTHHLKIDMIVEKIMEKYNETNSDILTQGRQTYDPIYDASVTAPVAYSRCADFIKENTGITTMTCLEWIQAHMKIFDKSIITANELTKNRTRKKIFNKETQQFENLVTITKKMELVLINDQEDIRRTWFKYTTTFGTYIKHKERGKKDRRAICSANIFLRMLLLIVEDFHLHFAKEMPGSTISIGGEDKKAKISNNLSNTRLNNSIPGMACQGTEDATKWNECVSPSAFATMHTVLFSTELRRSMGIPPPTEMGNLFCRIAQCCHYLQARKMVQLGKGVLIENDKYFKRVDWTKRDCSEKLNDITKEWYSQIKDKMVHKEPYIISSPGMLMGMLNAASTTLGLLAVNHRMDTGKLGVITLRSSDDSMTVYMADNKPNLKTCIEQNRKNLSLIGINLSPDKTFFFKEGFGEYTSWYYDGGFCAQYGVETSSIRPQGKNPYDDLYSSAKSTSVALSTLSINPMGASMRMRLSVDGCRRIWRINQDHHKRENIKPEVLMIEDGGKNVWNCMNSHLEEISIKERYVTNETEKNYLLRIINPDSPFVGEIKEEMQFSKAEGTMVMDIVETPRNLFTYIKRSNRSFRTPNREKQEEIEKSYGEACDIVHQLDPSTMLGYPISNNKISDHLISVVNTRAAKFNFTEDELAMISRAIGLLDGTLNNDDDQEADEFSLRESHDFWDVE